MRKIARKPKKLKLVAGTFSPDDAQEILLNLFSTKINFHQLKNFSSQERFGKDDSLAQKRIPQLTKSIETVKQIIAKAKSANKKLIVVSEVNITLAPR